MIAMNCQFYHSLIQKETARKITIEEVKLDAVKKEPTESKPAQANAASALPEPERVQEEEIEVKEVVSIATVSGVRSREKLGRLFPDNKHIEQSNIFEIGP
jgi:hypothetical protein